MADRIEWYLVELERMLKGKVPDEDLRELQAETRSHLDAAVRADSTSDGGLESIQQLAIHGFGSPDRLAHSFLYGSVKEGRVKTIVVLLLVFLAFSSPVLVMVQDGTFPLFRPGPFNLPLFILIWIASCIAALAGLFAFRGRIARSIVATCAAGAIMCWILTSMSVLWVVTDGDGAPVPINWAQRVQQEYRGNQKEIDDTFAIVKRGRSAFAHARSATEVPALYVAKDGYLVPKQFLSEPGAQLGLSWSIEKDFKKARHQWAGVSSTAANEFVRAVESHRRIAEAVEAHRPSLNSQTLGWSLAFWVGYDLGFTAIAVGIHLLVPIAVRTVSLARLRRRRLA